MLLGGKASLVLLLCLQVQYSLFMSADGDASDYMEFIFADASHSVLSEFPIHVTILAARDTSVVSVSAHHVESSEGFASVGVNSASRPLEVCAVSLTPVSTLVPAVPSLRKPRKSCNRC